MIFLTNEHIQQVLTMPLCLEAMEDAYRELNEQRAGYRPRIDFYVPHEPHYYRWGTMEGASRKLGVFAIRMKSDMLAWEEQDGFLVEDKYCIRRGTYCGLIFLFSTRNAEPLALMNDGYLQHMRVGACAGLGTKYLARKDSRVMAMIGSGGMARTYALAIKEVRPIESIRVFSPTRKNREAYASEMRERLGIEVVAVDSPEKALRGADIVSLTTDSLVPVIKAEWLEPGMHINNVRNNEAGPDVLARADVIARLGTSTLFADRSVREVTTGSDGMFGYIAGSEDEKRRIPAAPYHQIDNPNVGTVPDIMAGRWVGRADDRQITFLNNQGTQGLQFAAVGGTAYNLARSRGLGHPLPLEWFTQNIRD
ncbi:MAG TPA: ornithine cyclodeaminase family protein [candidate division Zixibacteria bacterium]|nr:ornithine cyclodeaminase family protein [candidate division Zixibacteria bacterium]